MHRRTEEHLSTARDNEALARVLITSSEQIKPPPDGWAVAIAFYAAVHYVNGYLWEVHRFRPANHQQRNQRVHREPALSTIAPLYASLQRRAYGVRYTPLFIVSARSAHESLEDLTRIAATIQDALPR